MEIRRYGEISKTEERDDGTLIVEGVISSEAEDSQGDVILAAALKAAIPDYFRRGPAVREAHDPQKPAGRALAMEVDPKSGKTFITAHVVDPITVMKIRTGVLTSWSLGGRVPPGGRDPDRPHVVRSIQLTECSLVDRGANPDARVTLWRSEDPAVGDGEQLAKVAARLRSEIAKVAALTAERDDALTKAAALGRTVRKVSGERDALRDRLVKSERRHAAEVKRLTEDNAALFARLPPKGSLRSVEISKAEDYGSAPARPPEPEDVHALIKVAQRRPAVLFDPPRP